ncbi:MAG TPA: HAD-IA family hydrolase, partial [Isosphaeraceae bacterium]
QLRDANIAGWVRRKQELTVALLADAPRLFPGLAALIRRLQPNTRLAVVSTTWRANIETVLRAAGLADAFELVVAKEDVEAPKPDPACYRLALARLRLSAPAAVALEDSPTGIASARAAGLRPVAVGHRRPPGDWNGTAPYLPDFTDIDAVLRTLEF